MPRTAGLSILILFLCCLSASGQQSGGPEVSSQDLETSASRNQNSSSTGSLDAPGPAAAIPDLTPDAKGQLSQYQMQKLIRIVADNYRTNYKRQRQYTYIDREVDNKLDGRGQVTSSESKTYEIMELYGEQVQRLLERNDKPLSEREAAKEEAKIMKLTAKRKNESEQERVKRQEDEEKQREKNREFVGEVADAYNFRLIGSELLAGRDTWVFDGDPRPEFHANSKEAQMLSKFRGRMWIDKSEMQLAKMDIEAIDTVSFGWVLARIHKGTRLVYEQARVNDEVWLPQHISFKFDARVALFKSYNEREEETCRDYRKFRTESKIVGMREAK